MEWRPMVMIPGGDYATARPTIASMQQVGWKFVCRYLRDLVKTNGDKSLSLLETQSLWAGGIDIVSNEETTGEQGLRGFNGGRWDAIEANTHHIGCGGPPSRPIYFSPWDHDPVLLTSLQWQSMANYLRGCASVLGLRRVGLYGGLDLIGWGFDNKLIAYGWEAAGWRRKRPSDPRSHIVQDTGSPIPGTDADTAVKSDYGQWHYGQQADWSDMATRDEVKQAVKDALAEWGAARHSDALAILGDQVTRPKNLASIFNKVTEIHDAVIPPPE